MQVHRTQDWQQNVNELSAIQAALAVLLNAYSEQEKWVSNLNMFSAARVLVAVENCCAMISKHLITLGAVGENPHTLKIHDIESAIKTQKTRLEKAAELLLVTYPTGASSNKVTPIRASTNNVMDTE